MEIEGKPLEEEAPFRPLRSPPMASIFAFSSKKSANRLAESSPGVSAVEKNPTTQVLTASGIPSAQVMESYAISCSG